MSIPNENDGVFYRFLVETSLQIPSAAMNYVKKGFLHEKVFYE